MNARIEYSPCVTLKPDSCDCAKQPKPEKETETKYMKDAREREFWRNVERRGDNDCWLWTGDTWGSGYGLMTMYRVRKSAHRVSWEIHNLLIPVFEGKDELCVCHKCDNRKCVNPAHLFLARQSENAADMVNKGRGIKGIKRKKDVIKKISGERNHNSKLTLPIVREIRSLYPGVKIKNLAKKYGVSYGAVYDVVRNVSWKDA